jgi:hypothetical protein
MSKYREVEIECPNCKEGQRLTVWDTLNTKLDPEAKELLFEKKINIFRCLNCAEEFLIQVSLLYHDQEKGFAVIYYPPQWIDQDNFIAEFEVEENDHLIQRGAKDYWSAFPDVLREASNYLRVPHIVFDYDDFLWYIRFRDRIFEKAKEKEEKQREEDIDEIKQQVCEIIVEVHKMGGGLLPDDEKKAIKEIVYDCEMHYVSGPNMFSSRADFYKFLDTEVQFHAKASKIDFEKIKEAYILWAKKLHPVEYEQLS